MHGHTSSTKKGGISTPSQTKIEELPGETLAFDLVPTMLHRGMNTVEVKLVSEEPSRKNDLVLRQIRVDVRYE